MGSLAALAGKSQREFKLVITKLEEMSGWPSEDVRQLAAVKQALRGKIASLGLDPDDTTAEELYHSLIVRYARDAAALERALNIGPGSSLAERVDKASQLVARSLDMPEAWALKTTTAKSLIKENPPKKLMKALHYRSVDSLLKREDVEAIFIGARLSESVSWHAKLEAQAAKLGTTAYQLRPLRIVDLDMEKLTGQASGEQIITAPEVGAVAASPSLPAGTLVLTIALMFLDGLESLGEHPLEHRLHRAHPALSWWAGAEHLSFYAGGELVSLNYKDVAQNHLAGRDFSSRECQAAQHHFWRNLMSGYKNYLDELPREVLSAEQTAAKQLNPAKELVPTLSEIEI